MQRILPGFLNSGMNIGQQLPLFQHDFIHEIHEFMIIKGICRPAFIPEFRHPFEWLLDRVPYMHGASANLKLCFDMEG